MTFAETELLHRCSNALKTMNRDPDATLVNGLFVIECIGLLKDARSVS